MEFMPLSHEDLERLLETWGMGTVLAADAPHTGTVNQTVLLTTTRGRYVLRGYRHAERAPVAREHAVIAHVRACGLPAVAPLTLPDGGTIHERGGRYYALFPWAKGRQVRRGDIGLAEAAAMGNCLARLHDALGGFPPDQVPRRQLAFTRQTTLAQMDRLQSAIRAGAGTDPLAAAVLSRLAGQRAHVEALPETVHLDFGTLEEQVLHGDYQESNLFFAAGQVSGIIDWDQTCLAPRAWEIVRTLDLVFGFDSARCHAFLTAYRAERPLALKDLDVAVAAYDVATSHNLWVYKARYFEGNERVVRFLRDAGPFVPVAERWAQARQAWA
jgi:Ser/Thr protein kinase RdoA (MazF antagonist)